MTKLAPEWVRTSDPVIRSPARYRWATAPALMMLEIIQLYKANNNGERLSPCRTPISMVIVCLLNNIQTFANISMRPLDFYTMVL